MEPNLKEILRIRDEIAQAVSRGDLRTETLNALRQTLELLDKDIAALRAKDRPH